MVSCLGNLVQSSQQELVTSALIVQRRRCWQELELSKPVSPTSKALARAPGLGRRPIFACADVAHPASKSSRSTRHGDGSFDPSPTKQKSCSISPQNGIYRFNKMPMPNQLQDITRYSTRRPCFTEHITSRGLRGGCRRGDSGHAGARRSRGDLHGAHETAVEPVEF